MKLIHEIRRSFISHAGGKLKVLKGTERGWMECVSLFSGANIEAMNQHQLSLFNSPG